MRQPGPRRLNRLPQRLDYTLIPAPLDLSLPLVDEKSALPAIIVTPSSPSGETDFSIAFLAPPEKPSLSTRMKEMLPGLPTLPRMSALQPRLPSQIQLPASPYKSEFDTSNSWSFKARASTSILLAILVFIMGCHLVMHSLMAFHPHLEYGPSADDNGMVASVMNGNMNNLGGVPREPSDSATPAFGGVFNLHSLWAPAHGISGRHGHGHHFIVSEPNGSEPEAKPVVHAA